MIAVFHSAFPNLAFHWEIFSIFSFSPRKDENLLFTYSFSKLSSLSRWTRELSSLVTRGGQLWGDFSRPTSTIFTFQPLYFSFRSSLFSFPIPYITSFFLAFRWKMLELPEKRFPRSLIASSRTLFWLYALPSRKEKFSFNKTTFRCFCAI